MYQSLYELGEAEAQCAEVIDLLDEVDDAEALRILREALNGTREAVHGKLSGYWYMVQDLKADEESLGKEIERLRTKKASRERRRRLLLSAVDWYLDLNKLEKIKIGHKEFRKQTNGGEAPVLCPEDPMRVPKKYRVLAINKELIAKDLKAGVKIPRCKFGPRGKHVRAV